MSLILIADDDRELCQLLCDYLSREGFQTRAVHDGRAALEALVDPARRPDLLILDIGMPGRDGLQTLADLRARHHLPVIMLSARGEPVDRVVGLELGADDYIAKPCLPRELLARVRARLRQNASAAQTVQVGVLCVLPAERRARIGDVDVDLTGAEFSLLLALAQRAGQVVDKAVLTREALGREIERFDRSVDVHLSRLRRKLAEASPLAPRIEAVRGAGYQLLVAADSAR